MKLRHYRFAGGRIWVFAGLVLFFGPSHRCAGQAAHISEADLSALLVGDGVPGFHVVPAVVGGVDAHIEIGVTTAGGEFVSRIARRWQSSDGLNWIAAEVTLYSSRDIALNKARETSSLSQVRHTEMPATSRIGDASWVQDRTSANFRMFVAGRAFALIQLGGENRAIDPVRGTYRSSVLDGHQDEIADVIARSVEWNLRQRPDLTGESKGTERVTLKAGEKTMGNVAALRIHDAVWAPLWALEQAGARVRWDAKDNLAAVTYRNRTLTLSVFQSEAVLNGRKIDLGARVLVGRDGPIVPLERIAAALEMRVDSHGKTLALGG